jgi:hypothetical protein
MLAMEAVLMLFDMVAFFRRGEREPAKCFFQVPLFYLQNHGGVVNRLKALTI